MCLYLYGSWQRKVIYQIGLDGVGIGCAYTSKSCRQIAPFISQGEQSYIFNQRQATYWTSDSIICLGHTSAILSQLFAQTIGHTSRRITHIKPTYLLHGFIITHIIAPNGTYLQLMFKTASNKQHFHNTLPSSRHLVTITPFQ